MSNTIDIPAMQIPPSGVAQFERMMRQIGAKSPDELLDKALRVLDLTTQAMDESGTVTISGNARNFSVKLK